MNLMSQKLLLEEINTIFRKFVVLTARWKAVKAPLNHSAFLFNCTHWPLYFTIWRWYVLTLVREGFLALEPKLPATSGWVSKRCACCFDVLLTSDIFIWKFYFWWLPSIFLWTFSKGKLQWLRSASLPEHYMTRIVSEGYLPQTHFVKVLVFARDDNTSLSKSHFSSGPLGTISAFICA